MHLICKQRESREEHEGIEIDKGVSSRQISSSHWHSMLDQNDQSRLPPAGMTGISFNIRDETKFHQALELLRESTGNLPMHCSDSLIVWNRNLSFLREDYYKALFEGNQLDGIEKSTLWRLYILLYFAEICAVLDGDFVELGCHKGSTALRVTEKVDFRNLGKQYWLYDLFEWKPGDQHTHLPAHDNPNMYEDVVQRFADQPWVRIIKGSVPESFEQGIPDRIAFAHIDMNHPSPESAALEMVLPRLSKGGFIVFDDYGWWGYSAQKRALDPIAEASSLSILELPTGQGLLYKRY